jgi:hypothetical protein
MQYLEVVMIEAVCLTCLGATELLHAQFQLHIPARYIENIVAALVSMLIPLP